MIISRPRWGDDDHVIGPFLYSRDRKYRHCALVLDSGEDEHPGCSIRVSVPGHTFILALPPIIQPWRRKVKAHWDAATVARLGRDWYYDEHPREYGFSLSEGHLHLRLGRQTGDSLTTQDWGCFLPWTQWRFIRLSIYGLAGEWFADEPKRKGFEGFEEWEKTKKSCPGIRFSFKDFDGEEIEAATLIEEREWHFGTGWFKWLSLFRPHKIRRSLDIQFNKETGKRKGSWKGGTVGHGIVGHGIDMLQGEFHESAFRRYCAEHEMTFVGAKC